MSKISRIRILNLNYNHDSIKIDDETFDLGGESTLISLRNGGGKSVLVQIIVSLFVNKTYRDFGDRAFKGYFNTNRPTFVMTEWKLDNSDDRFIAGMMVRKNQKEDNDSEELEMYNFTGSYSGACEYDLDNIPVVKMDGNRKLLKSFVECRNSFEEISRSRKGDFRLYDMNSRYGRSQYFSTLRQYQINNKEWESIIRKVNQKESGLSELFNNSKDEKSLIENWFLRPIEDKLNQDRNKIEEFRKLTFKFIEQYRSNQSKIARKAIIEKYFEDTVQLKEDIDNYVEMQENRDELNAQMIIYVNMLKDTVDNLENVIGEKQDNLNCINEEITTIKYEKISYQIYELTDKKNEAVIDRTNQEVELAGLNEVMKKLNWQQDVYDCNRIFNEIKGFMADKAEVDEKIRVLLEDSEDNRREIERIGHILYMLYSDEKEKNILHGEEKKAILSETNNKKQKASEERADNEKSIRDVSKSIGKLENSLSFYDEHEDTFNTEYQCDIRRNILGLYEDGYLDVEKRKMEEETQEERNNLARLSRVKTELERNERNLQQEENTNIAKIKDAKHNTDSLKKILDDLKLEKEYRLKVIKYIGLKESDVENRELILGSIDGKIKELDVVKSGYITQKAELEKKYKQLKEGKTVELTDNVKNYFDENGIDIVYGMEWLTKNGRTVKENTELVNNNPFLPYSIIMEDNTFERFKNMDEELYTSFPIPVIVRGELEKSVENTENHITTYGNIHFFVMFNNHLLDREELQKMLAELHNSIEELGKLIKDRNSDINTFNEYRINIENQTYTAALFDKTENDIAASIDEVNKLEERQRDIKHEKDINNNKKKENAGLISDGNRLITKFERRGEAFDKLCRKYEEYETDKASLSRMQNELKELESSRRMLEVKLETLSNEITGLKEQIKKYDELAGKAREKVSEYGDYAQQGNEEMDHPDEAMTTEQLEARFNALTKEVSYTMSELQKNAKKYSERIEKKENELANKNKLNIPEEEYENVVFSEEQYKQVEKQKEEAETEYNRVCEENIIIEKNISTYEERMKNLIKDLKKETGYDEPVQRSRIVDTEFDKRIKLRQHDAENVRKNIHDMDNRKNDLSAKLSGVLEYADDRPDVSEERLAVLKSNVPDLDIVDKNSLEQYQKTLRKKLENAKDALREKQSSISEEIRKIEGKEEYSDDYFRKTFASLLAQTGNPFHLLEQYNINKSSYESQLEKLKIDLANIDSEQKNIEEMFLEYIQSINDNIAMIDKNSTINVRNRSIKMLKIHVPDWDTEKEHFRLKLNDFFERVIKLGIDTIENNRNLDEFLGNVISTKKLYDDVVGINNIKIKLYKIEAEREIPISWAEVSANSGGEGFLSAFVILTCLLSYMRRDESNMFSSGEEGKVLIMDNPFAQTYSVHLLKPLMEMAKKTNTQLICLSGLGGDSIYNRFDNIYVLKLIDSNIRNGMQRIESKHIKGETIERMVLSEFKTEQLSLFDMWR